MAKKFLNNLSINNEYSLPVADGTNGQVIETDGAGNLSFRSKPVVFKAFTIESPATGEGTTLFYTPEAISLSRVAGVLTSAAAATVPYTVRFGTDRSATGTAANVEANVTSTTTGNLLTGFTSSAIPANRWVWVEFGTVSGTPSSINLTISYTV